LGRSAKLLLVLVLLGSLGIAYLALTNLAMRDKDAKRIGELSDKLATVERTFSAMKSDLEQKQGELDAAVMQASTLRSSLEASRRELDQLTSELAQKDAEISQAKQQYEQFTQAQSGLGDRVRQLEDQLLQIKHEKEELEAILGTSAGAGEGTSTGVTGRVELTREPGLVALRLDNAIPAGAVLDFYVHRGGEVVGKVAVRRIYYTNVVGRLSQPSRLTELASGDRVVLLEGERVPFAASLRGKVSAVYAPTFVTLEIGQAALAEFAPTFRLTLGDVHVGGGYEFKLSNTLFASVVVELESVAGIKNGDMLVAASR